MPGTHDFSSLFAFLSIGAYRCAPDGTLVRANPALVNFVGVATEAEAIHYGNTSGRDWYANGERRDEFRKRLFEQDRVTQFESQVVLRPTGELRWISENAHVVRDEYGRVIFYEGTVEDITPRKNAEAALALALRRYYALTAKSQSATLVCGMDGIITFASPAIHQLLGYYADEVVGNNIFETMDGEHAERLRPALERLVAHQHTGEEILAKHRHKDGSWRYIASLISDGRDDDAVGGLIVYSRDVTDAHTARMRLRHLSETDSLTGVFNRSMFERACAEAIDQSGKNAARAALFFIDLDNFKLANDSYGHWFGDQILIAIGNRLRTISEEHDIVARLGGDEFAVLTVVEGECDKAIEARAQALVRKLREPIRVETTQFEVTVSVGVACFPDHATTVSELLRYADEAMFAAKTRSRNAFCMFTPQLETRVRERVAMIADLRRAVANREFVVHYQPQIDMLTQQLTGAEALVRWQHPSKGLIAPDAFIQLAEEQGLINAIGLQVIEAVVPQIAIWRTRTGSSLRVAINVSAQQLRDSVFAHRLRALLHRHQLRGDAIEVEVTESMLLAASRDGRTAMEALRSVGVRIVLDDLGVGYSSMAYLRQFPVDGVKLDRGFVEGLPHQAVDAAIVRSIITLAHELNLTLVAEGIETPSQRDHLVRERCAIGQGYLFSRPLSVSDFEKAGWLGLPVEAFAA